LKNGYEAAEILYSKEVNMEGGMAIPRISLKHQITIPARKRDFLRRRTNLSLQAS